jgi:hypothetical protein
MTADRPFADPDKAARRLLEHVLAFEPFQDDRIYIEKLNGPFLFGDKARPRNTAPAWSSPSHGAGWKFITAALLLNSRRPAPVCSPKDAQEKRPP